MTNLGIPVPPGFTITIEEQQYIYADLLSLKASISIDGNPFSPYSIPETFTLKKDFTHVFLLSSQEEDIYKRLSRGAKSNLNQAQKKGVSIRTTCSEQDVSAYFGIYKNTLKRWGVATLFTYPEELFQNIFKRGGAAAKLWLAEKDESIIAGAIIFYWNRVVSYWHGASLKDYFDCYANNLLHMEIIKEALYKGYGYYDFSICWMRLWQTLPPGLLGCVSLPRSARARASTRFVSDWRRVAE